MTTLVRALPDLVRRLRRAGEHPNPGLLEAIRAQGAAAIPTLIDIAIDKKLHNAPGDRPEVWAPLHAIALLGDLQAAEAVAPLLPLFDWTDDDWLGQALPEALGKIGEPALDPLRGVLFDHTRDPWCCARAAKGLERIGNTHPELRGQAVATLVERLAPAESRTPDDEVVNAEVVVALMDLGAVEAADAIRAAYDEQRVDTSIVGFDSVASELGLATLSAQHSDGLVLQLECRACGYARNHALAWVYYMLGTEGVAAGHADGPSPFVIPQHIVCPQCGAMDEYDLPPLSVMRLWGMMFRQAAAPGLLPTGVSAPLKADAALRVARCRLPDGEVMHPFHIRERYAAQVADEPDRADARVRYAAILAFLGHDAEAIDQCAHAMRCDPANTAARLLRTALLTLPKNPEHAAEDRLGAVVRTGQVRVELLPAREGVNEPDAVLPGWWPASLNRPAFNAAPLPRKPGRNEPCYCGSGRKYKKCHGQ